MVLAAVDIPVNSYTYSGSPVIKYSSDMCCLLSQDEIERNYGLYQGSGGTLSGLYSFTLSGSNTQSKLQTQNKLTSIVGEICSVFSFTKDDLAQVCHIQSRKTLYNWIDGKTTPRASAMSRIFDLSIIAQAWKESGFSVDKTSLHQPILDQLTLFDLLSQKSLEKDLILFAGSRLNLFASKHITIEDPFA